MVVNGFVTSARSSQRNRLQVGDHSRSKQLTAQGAVTPPFVRGSTAPWIIQIQVT